MGLVDTYILGLIGALYQLTPRLQNNYSKFNSDITFHKNYFYMFLTHMNVQWDLKYKSLKCGGKIHALGKIGSQVL